MFGAARSRSWAFGAAVAAALATSTIPSDANATGITVSPVVDVSADQTAQNETPIAVNPANPANMITGANDWNYNDGCAVNATFDGGRTWTPTVPNGFVPGVTSFTNDPSVPGTGSYDAGGDPTIAFSPDGSVAYYVCQAFDFTSPYQMALLLNRSHDGGRTWQTSGLPAITSFIGNGGNKGSNGQFADHEDLHVDTSATSPYKGTLYVTWAQFNGRSAHSPVLVGISRDGGDTWHVTQVTTGSTRNNQDQRIVTAPDGTAFLTFDNGVQGHKGTLLYVSRSSDGGLSWSTPTAFAAMQNPPCLFPPTCFTISGGAFRAGGSYPAPAFDAARGRLDVVFPDARGQYAQVYFTSAPADDLSHWTAPVAIAPADGDRFQAELGVSPSGRIDTSFYDRSYSGNTLVDMTYATSSDGGATWRTARVTPQGFDPSQWGVPGGSSPRPFIGDYNGIASTDAGADLTWTGVADPAPYNLEIDYAHVTP